MDKENIKNLNADERPSKKASEAFDWIQCVVAALVLVILVFTFFGRIIGVDGSSMYPTLVDKERVIMSNLFYTPKQDSHPARCNRHYKTLPDPEADSAVPASPAPRCCGQRK